MPKAPLKEPFRTIESELVRTMMAGHQTWRPDLRYPESHSDMQACARAILQRFNVEMLPLDRELPIDEEG